MTDCDKNAGCLGQVIITVKSIIVQGPVIVFTTFHFLRNLQIDPISHCCITLMRVVEKSGTQGGSVGPVICNYYLVKNH